MSEVRNSTWQSCASESNDHSSWIWDQEIWEIIPSAYQVPHKSFEEKKKLEDFLFVSLQLHLNLQL